MITEELKEAIAKAVEFVEGLDLIAGRSATEEDRDKVYDFLFEHFAKQDREEFDHIWRTTAKVVTPTSAVPLPPDPISAHIRASIAFKILFGETPRWIPRSEE